MYRCLQARRCRAAEARAPPLPVQIPTERRTYTSCNSQGGTAVHTPAINEGCTRSLRISHTSRRAPLQPVSIRHRFPALLITRLISPVCYIEGAVPPGSWPPSG